MGILLWIRFILGTLFLLAGMVLFVVEIISVFKLDYVLNRMHAAATGDTSGIGLSLIGLMILNGFNLGRYWEIGPQKRLYIPAPLLKTGRNEIILFETDGKVSDHISLKDEPDIG